MCVCVAVAEEKGLVVRQTIKAEEEGRKSHAHTSKRTHTHTHMHVHTRTYARKEREGGKPKRAGQEKESTLETQ